MNFKKWLLEEKNDLDGRIRRYSRFRLILFLSATFGFFISLFWLWQKTSTVRVQTYDMAIFSFIERFKTQNLVKFFSFVTNLGDARFVIAGFLILTSILVAKRRKRAAVASLLSLVGSGIFVEILKNFFGRQRPFGCLLPDDCLSFPSGHVTLSFYFYGLLAYLSFRFLPISLKSFLGLLGFLGMVVILIAFSRLFLGLHYFSDIIGGFFLGGSWLCVTILLVDFLY